MKKYKSLALLAIIALVLNICAPTITNADIIENGKAALEVFHSDESGLAMFTGDELKVTVNGNTITGSFWDMIDVGSNVTVEYTVLPNYVFDGWFNNENEIVSTNTTYSFVMGQEDICLRAQISRADGKSARLEADPFWTNFGWNTPDYNLEYKTVTITNRGNLTIKNISFVYDETKLDIVYDNSDALNAMEPGQSFTYKVKPISGAFTTEEYSQNEWITFDGTINIDGEDKYYHSDAVVEIGVNETGEDPYSPVDNEIVVNIEGYDQKPAQGQNLPRWIATGANGNTRVLPEGTHWEMYNKNDNRWEMAPGEPISDGHYRYMVEIAVSMDVDENVEVLLQGDGIPEGTWYVMDVDRVEIDPVTAENLIFAYINDVDFSSVQENVTITYDANGGTPGESYYSSIEVPRGTQMYVMNPSTDLITPPQGQVFDGYLVDGQRYEIGQSFQVNSNTYIMYMWKYDPYADLTPIYNVHLTLEKPEVGATNEAIDVDYGGFGAVEGTIHPVVTTQPDEQIIVLHTDWIKGTYQTAGNEYDDIFEGTFEDGQAYYAWIEIEAKDGYKLDNNINILVNNEKPAEVFPIYGATNTMVIAKVYAGQEPEQRQADQIQIWKNDGGQISVDYTPSEPNIYDLNAKDPANWMNGGEVVQFYKGDSITVSARPNPGYEFVGWYHVDIEWAPNSDPEDEHHLPYQGEAISTDSSYTYSPAVTVVPGDTEPLRYVCARFEEVEPQTPTVVVHTVFMNGGGSYQVQYNTEDQEELGKQNKDLTSSGFFAVPEGNTMKLTAKPAAGYVFKGWYKTHEENGNTWVLDEIVSNKATYTFTPSGYPYLTPVFEQESPSQYKKGDLDRNGVVDANDASVALELYKAQSATAEDVTIGDMDENDLIDANDASLILEYYKTNN